jgi:hypothetical protein
MNQYFMAKPTMTKLIVTKRKMNEIIMVKIIIC